MPQKKILLFLKKFFELKRKKQIALCVSGVHLFLLLLLLIHHISIRSFKPSRPIAIRTIIQEKKTGVSSPKTTHPSQATSRSPPEKKTLPVKQIEQKKQLAPPKSKPKPTPPLHPKPDHQTVSDQQSIKEIDAAVEALNALSKPSQPKKKFLQIPSAIVTKEQNPSENSSGTYSEYLIAYLQKSLDLPEYGDVKMQLLIDREGRLLQSTVLFSENTKNSEFLKNRLPQLTFPCFNEFDIDEKTLTFTISFRNAKNSY